MMNLRLIVLLFFGTFIFACESQPGDISQLLNDPEQKEEIMNSISQDPELASEMMAELMEEGPMPMRDSFMIAHMSNEKFTHQMMEGYPGMMHNMMAHMMGSMATDSTRYMHMHQQMMKNENYRMMMHNWCRDLEGGMDHMHHQMNQ